MNEIKKQVPIHETKTAATKNKQPEIPKQILSPMTNNKQLRKSNNFSKKVTNQT